MSSRGLQSPAPLGALRLFGWLFLIFACGDPPTVPPDTGTLRILVGTSGATLDEDGYTYQVGSVRISLNMRDSLDLTDLPTGPTPLVLSGVAPNCRALSPGPSSVSIEEAQLTRVSLEIGCDSALSKDVIVFHRMGPGSPSIWMMRPDGTQRALLIANGYEPVLTPNRTRVLYYSTETLRLTVIKVDGTRWTNPFASLPGWQRSPDISPDGRTVIFVRGTYEQVGDQDIYRMNLDGSDVQKLSATPYSEEWPRWSPDGSRITFTISERAEVFEMDPDGSNPRFLLDYAMDARWAPDGSRLLFQTALGAPRYWTARADGTDLQPLPDALDHAEDVEWAPDGSSLLLAEPVGDIRRLSRLALTGAASTVLVGDGINYLGRWY